MNVARRTHEQSTMNHDELLTRINAHAEQTRALVAAVRAGLPAPHLPSTDAQRLVAIADTHLSQAFMALTRAVTQPTTR